MLKSGLLVFVLTLAVGVSARASAFAPTAKGVVTIESPTSIQSARASFVATT
jgi:hypothetical protein